MATGDFEYSSVVTLKRVDADSNKTSGGSQFRCRITLGIKEMTATAFKLHYWQYIQVLSGDFEGARLNYEGTNGSGTVNIYGAGNYYCVVNDKDLGWLEKGSSTTLRLKAWYTGGSGTTYQAEAVLNVNGFGTDDFDPPTFETTINGAGYSGENSIRVSPSGEITVTVPLCTSADWTTPLEQFGITGRPFSRVLDTTDTSMGDSNTAAVSASFVPETKLAELYAAYGGFEGYKAHVEEWRGTNSYWQNIRENCLYIYTNQRYTYGSASAGYYRGNSPVNVFEFDMRAGTVWVYDENGTRHEAVMSVYDSAGAAHGGAITGYI